MPDRSFLIRHGQSTFNAHFDVTGVDPLHYDARLSRVGREQVMAARITVQKLAVDLAVVSPLSRAIETCLGLFDPGETKIVVSALHRERLQNSCDIGRPPSVLASEFPSLDFSHLDNCWWHDGVKDERGVSREPEEVVDDRIVEFSEWLAARPEPVVAVIGHGHVFGRMTGHQFANCEIRRWGP